jgi:hypothetical protein
VLCRFSTDNYEIVLDTKVTDRILSQGKALVHAIEALSTIRPTGLPAPPV